MEAKQHPKTGTASGRATSPDRARLLATLLRFTAGHFRVAIVSPRSVVRYGLRQLVTHHVDGVRVVPPDDATDAHAARLAGEPRSQDVELTERENDVLTLIAQGRSNQLVLSTNSVKSYIRTAYKKIGATSRSQAVSWTLRSGRTTGWSPTD